MNAAKVTWHPLRSDEPAFTVTISADNAEMFVQTVQAIADVVSSHVETLKKLQAMTTEARHLLFQAVVDGANKERP